MSWHSVKSILKDEKFNYLRRPTVAYAPRESVVLRLDKVKQNQPKKKGR